ncbi:MAG: VC_2705 family sodium/solute symporter, partial [Paracoccus sp. (in: a-proteobacteria)]|nr:VC_2705 family sodium/solute symporter [Paracoccus sp. (in: a-proteobacteria)]
LMIGTAGLPHVIIRFFTVPKVSDARSSAGWALVFIAALYTVAPAVGAMARLNLTTTMWPESSAATTTYDGNAVSLEAIQTAPELEWMRNWQVTGLLNWEDKNGDGLIQYYNDRPGATNSEGVPMEDVAAQQGWAGNELVTLNADIMVLANPEIANLPGWVIAIVAAGGLAAALSTAAGLLLAISGAVSHDLIKGAIAPHISERQELMWARISMGISILVATILGLNPPGFAAQTVALAFGLAASSIFPVLMMGIFSKRVNSQGAIWGMLAGMISTTVYIFIYKGWFFIAGTNMLPDTAENWLFGISPAAFGTIGALINFAVAYIVSGMTGEVPEDVKDMIDGIRVPKGASAAIDH